MKYNVVFVQEFNDVEIAVPGVVELDHVSGYYTDYVNPDYVNILIFGIPYTIMHDKDLQKYLKFDESDVI
jgi:hypothetical protein